MNRRLSPFATALGLARLACLVAVAASGLAMGVPAAAIAQEIPNVISPLIVEPDRNGVNLADGRMTPDVPTLSVPGAPHLKFDHVQNAAPYVVAKINAATEGGAAKAGSYSVHTAEGTSESFMCDEVVCDSLTGSGSLLHPGGGKYQREGSAELYGDAMLVIYSRGGNIITKQQYYRSVTYPDGEVISYTYDSATLPNDPSGSIYLRPIRLTSNLGYYITITYRPGALGVPEWSIVQEAAIYNAASPATPLGRLTYGTDGTVTDLAGRVYQGVGDNELGVNLETVATSLQLPGEASVSLTVAKDPALAMIGSVTRDGVQWNYAYTNPIYYAGWGGYAFDRITATGPNGYSHAYDMTQWQSRNIIVRSTDELNRSTAFQYDAGYARVAKITYPEGNSVSAVYDARGNITQKTTTPKVGSGLSPVVENAFVDLTTCVGVNCWRPVWYRDGLNRQTDYVYNANGQLTEETDPADSAGVRRKVYIDYDPHDTGAGIVSRKKDVRICGWHPTSPALTTCGTNQEFRTEYDYWGNTLLPSAERQVNLATGAIRQTSYTYDDAGRVLSIDGPLAGTDDTHYFRYDTLGRKTWEIGELAPSGRRLATRFTYRDADDKVTLVESGTVASPTDTVLVLISQTATSYDGRRNPIREATSSTTTVLAATDRSFLDRGLAECVAVRMNPAALPAATAAGACTPGSQGANGRDRIAKNVYDAAGQLLKVQQGVGTSLQRDEVTYTYTPNGRQEFVTDARGNKAQFKYDGLDRQSYWYFPSPTAAGTVSTVDYEQYGYDAAGNRSSVRKRDGRTFTFAFDGRNRIISKIVPDACVAGYACTPVPASATRDVYYSYDAMDHPLSARFDSAAGADGVVNHYNGFGELDSSTIAMAGFSKAVQSQYDAGGRRTLVTHPDSQAFTYAYDALGRLADLYSGATANASNLLDHFAYQTDGRLASRSEGAAGSNGVAYGWDAIGRLQSQSDSYAGGGNLAVSLSYNPASQIVGETHDNVAYAYGGLKSVTRAYTVNGLNQYAAAGTASFTYDANGNLISDGSTAFIYDAENRLVCVASCSAAALTYDPLGRLWQVVKGTSNTRFLYDGDALIGEYDGAGTLTARYVHGSSAGADDPLVWFTGAAVSAAATRYLHADHEGSIVAATNNTGAPTIDSYDEYGVPNSDVAGNSLNVGRFQYTGQIWLPEIGMYHYKARAYSPTLGRFMQTDPVGYKDQINLYEYVGNDPVDKTDPSGNQSAPEDEVGRNRSFVEGETTPADIRTEEFRVTNHVLTTIRNGRGMEWISAPGSAPSSGTIRAANRQIADTLIARATTERYNSEGLTLAGRSISDHPEVLGFRSTSEFQQQYRTVSQVNEAGQRAISSIVNNGRMELFSTKSSGPVVSFVRGDGFQARFSMSGPNAGAFIGFANPRRFIP